MCWKSGRGIGGSGLADRRDSGSGMIGALVAAGVIGVLAVAANSLTSGIFRATKSASTVSDAVMLRSLLFQSVDMAKTLEDYGVTKDNYNTLCPSTSIDQQPPFFRLRRRTLDPDRPATYFTGPLLTAGISAGAAKWGDFFLRASCSFQEESMVIRIARVDSSGQFRPDPLTGKVLDWNSNRGLLFGKGKEYPLASMAGDYVKGAQYGACSQRVLVNRNGTIAGYSPPTEATPPAIISGNACGCEPGFDRTMVASIMGFDIANEVMSGTVSYACVKDAS